MRSMSAVWDGTEMKLSKWLKGSKLTAVNHDGDGYGGMAVRGQLKPREDQSVAARERRLKTLIRGVGATAGALWVTAFVHTDNRLDAMTPQGEPADMASAMADTPSKTLTLVIGDQSLVIVDQTDPNLGAILSAAPADAVPYLRKHDLARNPIEAARELAETVAAAVTHGPAAAARLSAYDYMRANADNQAIMVYSEESEKHFCFTNFRGHDHYGSSLGLVTFMDSPTAKAGVSVHELDHCGEELQYQKNQFGHVIMSGLQLEVVADAAAVIFHRSQTGNDDFYRHILSTLRASQESEASHRTMTYLPQMLRHVPAEDLQPMTIIEAKAMARELFEDIDFAALADRDRKEMALRGEYDKVLATGALPEFSPARLARWQHDYGVDSADQAHQTIERVGHRLLREYAGHVYALQKEGDQDAAAALLGMAKGHAAAFDNQPLALAVAVQERKVEAGEPMDLEHLAKPLGITLPHEARARMPENNRRLSHVFESLGVSLESSSSPHGPGPQASFAPADAGKGFDKMSAIERAVVERAVVTGGHADPFSPDSLKFYADRTGEEVSAGRVQKALQRLSNDDFPAIHMQGPRQMIAADRMRQDPSVIARADQIKAAGAAQQPPEPSRSREFVG